MESRRPQPVERASFCLSAGAFVLSACALLVALSDPSRSGGAALVREPAAANYVSLGGLIIQPGQIAEGAVGTQELAAGAVTLANLDADAVAAITAASRASSSIVGEVDESGDVTRGSGFTATRLHQGEYALTFATPFATPPVIVAVAQQYAVCYQPSLSTLGPDQVHIKCMSDLLGNAPSPMNTRFSFYAAAPPS